jgi:hypothetical protein
VGRRRQCTPGRRHPIFDTDRPAEARPDASPSPAYGLGDDPTLRQSIVGLQVRTRGAGEDPREPRNLNDAIADRLLGRYPLTLPNGIRVTTIERTSAVSLGQEDGGDRRWSYVSNYRLTAYNPTTHPLSSLRRPEMTAPVLPPRWRDAQPQVDLRGQHRQHRCPHVGADRRPDQLRRSTPTRPTWSATPTRRAGLPVLDEDRRHVVRPALTLKRAPKATDATTYDVAQEYLRTHSIGVFGNANRVQLRISEYDPNDPNGLSSPRVEAYTGFAVASWEPQGGDMLAEDNVVVTLQGQGKLTLISHPYPVTALVPTITAVSPATGLAAAGGDLVQINGTGFLTTVATTGVKIGGVNCPQWDVVADNIIVAKTSRRTRPAAGVVVLVTNAAGPSTGGPTVTYV